MMDRQQESNSPTNEMVRAEKIVKYFGNLMVLDGIDLSVKRGQAVVIIGPSGSGKTTCLRCINHLEKIDKGRIYIEGQLIGYREVNGQLVEDKEAAIARIRSQIGFVFQRFNLFPHLTVLENVIEAPIHVLHQPKAAVTERAMELLTKVGLAEKAHVYPHKLSGGQQQRVAVARALVGDPLILMADEPTGNLDSKNGEAVMELLRDLHRNGATICMVTHDQRYANFAERTIHLFDGRIVEETREAEVGA